MPRVSSSRRLLLRLRHGGLPWLWYAVRDRIAPVRPGFWTTARAALLDRAGLEVGGPSRLFAPRAALPAYEWVARLDNLNFATETAWEHGLEDGGPFVFHRRKPPGRQWLREATATGLADASQDCVLSSHCLEHVANPLAALGEWRRITRPGGHLLLVLPDPRRTFDRRRPVTTAEHLRADRDRHTGEDDPAHFAEVLALHDLALDPDARDREAFARRVAANAVVRCVHHHVFDEGLVATALRDAGWQPLAVERFRPLHLGALARREAA